MDTDDQKHDFDLSVFETIGTECFGKNGKVHIPSCDHIVRMVLAMNYYQALRRSNDKKQLLFFCEFIATVYGEAQIMNDWIHFMQTHSHQIEDIHDQLTSSNDAMFVGGGCDGKKGATSCSLFRRHYDGNRWRKHNELNGSDDVDSGSSDGVRMAFWGEMFDRIHHFLYHLFDAGMRTKKGTVAELSAKSKDEDSDDIGKTSNEDEYGFIDDNFAMKRHALNQRREKLRAVTDRYDGSKHNKFTIATSENDGVTATDNQKRKPFIDVLFEMLAAMYCPWHCFCAFWQSIESQEYDTDAIVEDIGRDGSDSNLIGADQENEYGMAVIRYVQEMHLSRTTFSTGITWFYWDAYKREFPTVLGSSVNHNNYGGYSARELYVRKRYGNYKEEILQHLSISDYKTLVLFKIEQYMASDAVKRMKVPEGAQMIYQYGIVGGNPISKNHICSIILYCDFSEYCRNFSATFRLLDRWETIASAKLRNQEYYWQSRYFRETVELFGLPSEESGPFFCGVDRVMAVPSFCLRLCAPSSTSMQMEVAMNFAKEQGMIIQLNNNGHVIANLLSFFDCSWLSNFADEDERVFCGGFMTIRMESIRIVSTAKNYEMVIHTLFVLDCMLSGVGMNGDDKKLMKLRKKELILLERLLATELSVSTLSAYAVDQFQSYRRSKKEIKFLYGVLKMCFDYEIYGHIIQSQLKGISRNNIAKPSDNMISRTLLRTFCYTESLIINTFAAKHGKISAKFDVIAFADVIADSSLQRIVIEDVENSWISELWNSTEQREKIRDIYDAKGLDVKCEPGTLEIGNEKLQLKTLVITKF